jgi:hypothetical protein
MIQDAPVASLRGTEATISTSLGFASLRAPLRGACGR